MSRRARPQSLIAQIKALDPRASTEELERALSVAPGLVAVEGILGPLAEVSDTFYQALNLVMSEAEHTDSRRAYETLMKLDTLVARELRTELLGREASEIAELSILYAEPQIDAAYALGLAIGLLFAGGVR